jgi:hypothetical protein
MLRALGALLFTITTSVPIAAAADAMPLPPQPAVHHGIPANYMMVSPCIATMGEHWVNLNNMNQPIYGTYEGKPIFTEIMVPLTQLQKGFSIDDVRALPGYRIDHVDFEFEPNGHPGMMVPHYDLHAYYVSAAFQAKICPNGVPNPALKPASQQS